MAAPVVAAAAVTAAAALMKNMFANMAKRKAERRKAQSDAKLAEGRAGEKSSQSQSGALKNLMSIYSRK